MDSTTIKRILAKQDTPNSRKQGKGNDDRIVRLKSKINDTNYVDYALKKIANDLAKEFF